ncbi:hypothetical protein B0H34DRAFT_691981 [Crassisporium funariophilum]|nr:hypothetical protein B0H34DRAFT_691981 [Crassisporium funariophilum]
MFTTNPYGQARGAGRFPLEGHSWPHALPHSPTFGALPPTVIESSPKWIAFTFVSADGDLLDCSVGCSRKKSFFDISTTSCSTLPTMTTIRKHDGTTLARVEWRTAATVEIMDLVPKQLVSEWITTSTKARNARVIHVGKKQYVWEVHNNTLYLYSSKSEEDETPEILAKFLRRRESLVLELTPRAIQLGLLDLSVVALVLITTHHKFEGSA